MKWRDNLGTCGLAKSHEPAGEKQTRLSVEHRFLNMECRATAIPYPRNAGRCEKCARTSGPRAVRYLRASPLHPLEPLTTAGAPARRLPERDAGARHETRCKRRDGAWAVETNANAALAHATGRRGAAAPLLRRRSAG